MARLRRDPAGAVDSVSETVANATVRWLEILTRFSTVDEPGQPHLYAAEHSMIREIQDRVAAGEMLPTVALKSVLRRLSKLGAEHLVHVGTSYRPPAYVVAQPFDVERDRRYEEGRQRAQDGWRPR